VVKSDDPLYTTPGDVDREIIRLSDELEDATEELIVLARDMAVAKHAYKVASAKEWVKAKAKAGNGRGGITTDGAADAQATIETEALYLAHLTTEALHGAQQEKLRAWRSRMESLRTIAANIREQTRG
jgi:hypothetical protein